MSIVRGPHRPDLLRQEVLADLFEATARRLPDKTALIFSERCVTYRELDELADRAAARLIQAGVRPGQIVGLWLGRGVQLLALQLAITKSGAAWLPFDAQTPATRVAECLSDAAAVGLVSGAGGPAAGDEIPRAAAAPAGLRDGGSAVPPAMPCRLWSAAELLLHDDGPRYRRERLDPQHPAYVIYTSGSTGKPKGIAVSHASICHFLRSENSVLGIVEEDRVYQGFSAAFDMSFEEIWISYLVGATLWIAPAEVTVDFQQLQAALVQHRITVLHAVPTLVALLESDVPGLRLLNLGGEACPDSLVDRWATLGRRVFNSYGPTEATVSASIAELARGEPVTIGTPLPNCTLLILFDGGDVGLTPAPVGETGELCIAGPCVAIGYLGRPDLSAQKFLPNPWPAGGWDRRLYRTGDLARVGPDGRVECLGRTDDQVKVRGFRVELGEIESVLAGLPAVGAAAVMLRHDNSADLLVAFLQPKAGETIDPVALRQSVAQRLPLYMVPGRFERVDELPRLVSGKLDRSALRLRPLAVQTETPAGDEPVGDAESALFDVLARLFPGQPLRRDDDFFGDLGGHSLLAARVASALREQPRYRDFSVTTIYRQRTLAKIAALMPGDARQPPARAVRPALPPWRRWCCGAAQGLVAPFVVAMRMSHWLLPFFIYHYFTGDPEDSTAFAVAAAIGAYVLATLSEFALPIATKWLVAGRLKPGRYPLWGLTYFRWWLVDRMVDAPPTYLLSGTNLYELWLRALGAKVGRGVYIGSMTVRAPDLLEVQDGVSIGHHCQFENARVENGELILGPIRLERDAVVASYVVLEGGVGVGCGARLGPQSALADGHSVPAGRSWSGSPARDNGKAIPADLPARRDPTPISGWLYRGVYAGGGLAIAILFYLPVFPVFLLMDRLDLSLIWEAGAPGASVWPAFQVMALALPASALLVVSTVLLAAVLRRLVMPRLVPGQWPVHSAPYRTHWFVDQIQQSCLQVLRGIHATVYAASWCRLLGGSVGANAEISTAVGFIPELLQLGDETFVADAVMLGDPTIEGGWMRLRRTEIGRRTFLGNQAYVPDGTCLPDDVLIGVLSCAPPNDAVRRGDTWIGTPVMPLPAREPTVGFADDLTFHPPPWRRLARGLTEGLRIVIPQAFIVSAGYVIVLGAIPYAEAEQWLALLAFLGFTGLGFGMAAYALVAALKWSLIGRYDRQAAPMWTPFVWLSEGVTNLYESLAVPSFLNLLRGTPWLPVLLRVLGCRIGDRVYLDSTDMTEFDCVHIGDDCEINGMSFPQTHLFEDRVMKIDHVFVGDRVYMGPRSIALYGSRIDDDVRLGPLTLIMKGEHVGRGTSWQGNPAGPA